jgi:hypothetical protein
MLAHHWKSLYLDKSYSIQVSLLRMEYVPVVSFLNPQQITELCTMAFFADKEARSDLVRRFIRDEDDYTSNFTGALRRIINSNSQTGLSATSYMLNTSDERRTGTDATIIITRHGHSKIALFEAKLPHSGGRPRRWDYPQTAAGDSHFSDQLARQAALRTEFAIFEIFYCDYGFGKQPAWMDNELSSCVWHTEAIAHDAQRSSRVPWRQKDLQTLLLKSGKRITDILKSLADCSEGQPIPMGGAGNAIAGEMGLEGPILQITAGEPVPQG